MRDGDANCCYVIYYDFTFLRWEVKLYMRDGDANCCYVFYASFRAGLMFEWVVCSKISKIFAVHVYSVGTS